MPDWEQAEWYQEYVELTARDPFDQESFPDEAEPSWDAWRMRVERIRVDLGLRLTKAQEAQALRAANPDKSWEEIAGEVDWQRPVSLLKDACDWIERANPDRWKHNCSSQRSGD